MDYFGLILICLFLLPIVLVGALVLKYCSTVSRFELVFPTSIILGITLFVVILNTLSFVIKPPTSIVVSYLIFLLVSILFSHRLKDFGIPKGRVLVCYLIGLCFWGGFIFWKSAFALLGSDTNLYYSIASSFAKGNFPFFTPWQPDIKLSYHVGILEFIGAFKYLTNFSFEFLHTFFSFLFIFCSSQIILWIWERHQKVKFFLLANLAAAAVLISFGLFKFVFPGSLAFPTVISPHGLIVWLRGLPSTGQTIEPYGVPVDLDALVYVIFHAGGLAVTLTIVVILANYRKERKILTWIVLFVSLTSLAIIHESFFIVSVPAVLLGLIFIDYKEKALRKNIGILFTGTVIFLAVTLLQGGVIGNSLFQSQGLEKTIILFPKKGEIKANFWQYHLGQEMTRLLPNEDKWQPFRWINIGVDLLLILSILILWRVKLDFEKKLLLLTLFVIGVVAIVSYNVVVPKYIVANGNRLIAIAYQFLSLLIFLSLIPIFKSVHAKKHFILKLTMIIIIFNVSIPTFAPILARVTKTRFGESKFSSRAADISPTVSWISAHIPIDKKIMVFDARTPHPSAVATLLIGSGNLVPLFPSGFKAYTIEPSPEYIDAASTLNPTSIKSLDFSIIVIDDVFYDSLPEIRKSQLMEGNFFELLYEYQKPQGGWEKVFKITESFVKDAKDLPGTLNELSSIAPENGKYYIDSERYFKVDYLRRPIIFSLRNRELYFPSESGVYLNVETYVPLGGLLPGGNYDFMLLPKTRSPEKICKCKPVKIWTSEKLDIILWKNDFSVLK